MKVLQLFVCLLLLPVLLVAQAESEMDTDCNPKLKPEEMAFLRNKIDFGSFDFSNKNIGFAYTGNSFKLLGLANSFLPITKKEYFRIINNDAKSRLINKFIILDSSQKMASKGFDALILVCDKRYEKRAGQMNNNRIVTVFGYRELNYPDNIDFVGKDSNAELSLQDAIFFNRIFQWERKSFDFTGKKIAYIQTTESDERNKIKTKRTYIDRIKNHLEEDFLFPYDNLYLLNETEKAESGGYDAVIMYQCLKCGVKDALYILKKNGI